MTALESPSPATGGEPAHRTGAVLLAIETSGLNGSVALCRDGQCLEQSQLELGKQHGQVLIPEIHALLKRHGLTARQCTHLAVSVGPGSFTGLRVGIVCAKTFAYATGCRLLAVGTLPAVAAGVADFYRMTTGLHEDIDALVVVSDAQRGDLFVQKFVPSMGVENESRSWQADGPIMIQSAELLKSKLSPRTLVAGPGLVQHSASLQSVAPLADETTWHPLARSVAHLATLAANRSERGTPTADEEGGSSHPSAPGVPERAMLTSERGTPTADGESGSSHPSAPGDSPGAGLASYLADPWKLEPLYLRRSSAEDKWDALGRK